MTRLEYFTALVTALEGHEARELGIRQLRYTDGRPCCAFGVALPLMLPPDVFPPGANETIDENDGFTGSLAQRYQHMLAWARTQLGLEWVSGNAEGSP